MLTYLKLKVQGLCGDKVSSHELERCGELLLKLFAAHDLGGLGYLSKQFLQTSEETDETALIDIGHFAAATLVTNHI
jgi:hypothetical protein